VTVNAALRLAPGSGHVARRGDALLYLPEQDERLLEAFVTSVDGGELQAVASATVAAGFDVAPFVGVAWSPAVRVMAFGDVAVETDQPSLPMLSGAASRTWVEHSFTVTSDARVEVGAADATADAATDLTSGVALAGGFRLELAVVAEEPATAVVEAAPAESVPVEETIVDATAAAARPRDEAPARPSPRPPEPATDDPAAALAAIQAAAMGADGQPVHDVEEPADTPPPVADEVEDPHDAEITLPPPPPGELLGDVMRLGGAEALGNRDSRESLVEAKLCPDGHPNPPVVASCAVCGKFLTPGTAAIVHVPRPSLGHLELDDGTMIELDHELLIGRNPDGDEDPQRAGLRPVKVVGEKVSRSHLEVRYQGWDILVADCGSTNGTFVVPHPGGQVSALEPGRAQLLEPGATVYFGSRSFTLVGRESDEE
jgi:FHA domain